MARSRHGEAELVDNGQPPPNRLRGRSSSPRQKWSRMREGFVGGGRQVAEVVGGVVGSTKTLRWYGLSPSFEQWGLDVELGNYCGGGHQPRQVEDASCGE